MNASLVPGHCPQCGAGNPPGARICAYCRGALPQPPPTPADIPDYRTDDAITEESSDSRWSPTRALVSGIFAVILSLVVFGIGEASQQSVQNFNTACSNIPNCSPEADPSGGFFVFGFLLLLLGIGIIWWSLRQMGLGSARDS